MLKNNFGVIAKIMLLFFVINLLPTSFINTFATTEKEKVEVSSVETTKESIYGPYDGNDNSQKAYDPFSNQSNESKLEGYEYSKDTLLIKTKNKFRLFGRTGIKNEAIENIEVLDIFNGKQKTLSTENDGTWFKAQLKEDSNIENVMNELNQDDDVLAVEPEYIRKLETIIPTPETDGGVNEQWYLDSIGVTDAWRNLQEQGIEPGGSSDIVVAVIDTGVDYTHPDLASNIWTNHQEIEGDGVDNDNNGYVDDIHGATTIAGQHHEQPMDYNGHGTHVAGIIAAEANNGLGGTGIAYNVKIMPIKAAQDGGILTSSDIARAIIYAAENGADVINMSFGGYGRSILEEDALAMAFSTSVLVAASGNDGIANEATAATPTGKPMYPAAYPWVLGVMASSQTANAKGDWLANFSNWDINTENSFEYELMAPGSKIYSTLPNNQYAKWDGTSMAAPVVSAIAALVRSKFNDKEMYSSRFIMGQLASTGVEKQGKTYSNDAQPKMYKEINALNALIQTPKPNVTYIEHYLFDKSDVESTTAGDGIVDAGETIDIGMVIRNHWGKAEDVNVKIDAVLPSGQSDPYVEIVNGTVNYGAIGNFGTDDNGFIYENDVIVGVEHPFTVKVKENAPNNHYVKLNVSITAKNGFDSSDNTIYSTEDSISFVTRKGTILPSVIDKDMTLTKDKYWIIPNATVIEPNVTVNVEPGTQIQFWASEPEDPYAEKPMAYLQVKGNLFVNGTAEEPVEMFASSMWRGYEVKIFNGNEMYYHQDNYYNSGVGNVELNYAKISNPQINVNKINNCYYTQDEYNVMFKRYLDSGKVETIEYYGPRVLANEIKSSKFYKLGYQRWSGNTNGSLKVDGKLDNNIFDNCYYYFDDKIAENNVFLNNYKLNGEQYGDREYWTSQGSNFGITVNKDAGFNITTPEKFNYTGSTYVGVNTSLYEFSHEEQASLVKEFAATLGGEIAKADDELEQYFIEDYLNRNMISNELLIEIPGISNVEYVTLNNSKLELGAGGAANKLVANIYPSNAQNKNVSWVSSNPEIATVDSEGNVTPLVEGKTTITVTTEDGGHTATCEVLVKTIVPATGIKLNKTELILEKGSSEQLLSEILPSGATDRRVQWISSNEEVATVDEFGNVTAKELGSTTIIATALDGNFTATCTVDVVVPVTGIEVDKELLRLVVGGESVKLNAHVIPENASIQDIIWTTSDDQIVTVDNEGNVTPIKEGTVMVTAKSKDGNFKKNVIVTVWQEDYSFNPVKVVAGERNTVILNDDGSVWVAGDNYKNTPITIPQVSGFEGKVIDIAIGTNYYNKIYMLTDKGYVYEGDNYSIGYYNKVQNLTGITKISSGYDHLLALKNDGTVWAKGYNDYGQLGDGSKNYGYEVIQVDGLTDIVDISAGHNSSAAVSSDGSLYTWGYNWQGMIGIGNPTESLYPQKVNNVNNAKKVEVNYSSTTYLSNDNKLYYSGYIGSNGTNTFEYIDSEVISVDASDSTLLYVKNDGRLYVMGHNNYGELGIRHTEYLYGKTLNENITDVRSIHSGYEHNIVIKNDGSVYAFGRNDYGQLGNMSSTNSSVPVQVLLGILPDDVNPTIVETYPESNSNGIELNPTISIKFEETINSSSKYGQIRLKDSEGNILSIKNKKIEGKVLSFELISKLQYGKTYTVEIPEDAVVDMFGNKNNYYSFNFTTKNEGLFSLIKKMFSKDTVEELNEEASEELNNIDENNTNVSSLIKSVDADIAIEEINEKAEQFFTDDKKSQIKNNAILNRWHDANVEHWMRFTAPSGDNNTVIYMSGNYWVTTSDTLIGKALVDYEDFKSLAKVKYLPVLEEAPETAYPFATNIYLTNSDGTVVNKVGAEKVNVHVTFNKDMNTNVEPTVTFGPDMPTTDYRVTTIEEGGWINSREWVGQINITPMTGDGYQFFRVIGAQAADNPWYVSGDDRERFKFEIITSGVESMNLQAEGNGNKIKLSWFQDDFDTLAGYNVYRAESEDGNYEKINKAIIPSYIKEFEDSNVEPGKTYYYKFTVLQTDMTESDYSNIVSAAAIDNVLPIISHNIITESTAYVPIKITANVTDNVAVQNVSLYFRKTGEASYKKREMTYLGSEKYSASIEGSNATPEGIEYYIEATDGVNIERCGTAEKPNKITIADTPKITSISPKEGPSNGGTKVTITGTNFKEGAKVKFNGVESKEVIVESSTRLTAITPSNNPGNAQVTVENLDGRNNTFNNGFIYKTEGITITVNSIEAKKGTTIEVPVSIDYVEGLNSIEMKFNYDNELLEFVGVRSGELTSDFMSASNEITEGQVSISMAGADVVNGRGNILYVKMNVRKDSLVDKNSSKLEVLDLELNGGAITGEVINGTFTVTKGQSVSGNISYFGNYQGISSVDITLTSDVDKHSAITDNSGYFNIRNVYNGTYAMTANKSDEINGITSYDASLILQHIVGSNTLGEYAKIAADVNSDGKVNATDAAQILAYSAGKITLPFNGSDSIWKFESDYKNITVEDYSQWINMYGILLGDVSGNWNSYSDPDVRDSSADFNTGVVTKNDDGTYNVPILVSMNNANLFGTDIVLTYDSTIGKPIRVEKEEYISNFALEERFTNTEEDGVGEINISLAGAKPYDTSGQFINVVFESKDINALAATTKIKEVDINENSVNSVIYEPKDVNGDKKIDILDISEVAINYNSTNSKPTWKDKLDINRDGVIDIFDLIQVARNI